MVTISDVNEVYRLALVGLAVEEKLGKRVSPEAVRRVPKPRPPSHAYSWDGHDDWVAVSKAEAPDDAPIGCPELDRVWPSVGAVATDLAASDAVPQTEVKPIVTSVRRVLIGLRGSYYGMRFSYLARKSDIDRHRRDDDDRDGDATCDSPSDS